MTSHPQTTFPKNGNLEHDIFLSYAREDIEKARYVANKLENQGYSVFWDSRIIPGDEWRDLILQTLNKSKCVLVAWSRHSTTSRWVLSEAEEGRRQNKLVPVLFDNVDSPFGYGDIHAADLTQAKPRTQSEAFQFLLRAIDARLGRGALRREQP